MDWLEGIKQLLGSSQPSYSGAGNPGQFNSGAATGLSEEQIRGLIKKKEDQQFRDWAMKAGLSGEKSGLGAQQYNATPLQSLMSMSMQGAGQQPQKQMAEQNQYIQSLMRG